MGPGSKLPCKHAKQMFPPVHHICFTLTIRAELNLYAHKLVKIIDKAAKRASFRSKRIPVVCSGKSDFLLLQKYFSKFLNVPAT